MPVFVTSLAFTVGYIHLLFYFNVFGINLLSLHLTPTYYFQHLFLFLFLICALFAQTYCIAPLFSFLSSLTSYKRIKAFKKDNIYYIFLNISKDNAFVVSLSCFILLVGLVLALFDELNKGESDFGDALLMFWFINLGFFIIFALFSKVDFKYELEHNYLVVKLYNAKYFTRHFYIGLSSLIIFLILKLVSFSGHSLAIDVIEGNSLSNPTVTFQFNSLYKEEKIRTDIENKELIFITYANESYYLVEKNKNFDIDKDIPNVYIIPKEEIKFINLKRIKNN